MSHDRARPQLPVLVVDDDAAIRGAVSETLRDEGYCVEEAGNGAIALALLARLRPVTIVLDLQMPVLDGWGFLQALGTRSPRIPIVVMSATVDAGSECQELGADTCLMKPFDLNDLLCAVERIAGVPDG